MFIENYQSGDALSKSLDSRLNSSSLLWQLHELFATMSLFLWGWGINTRLFYVRLALVFFRL